MSFSNEWESVYRAGQQHTAWPWSDLISLVFRYTPVRRPGCRVLELGCGTGANAPFFLALGASYSAIEGSASAVTVVHERFPTLRETVCSGDFTQAFPSTGPFDVIVDRASITHNSTQAIERCLRLIEANLVPGGYYVGIDWFSDRHSDRRFGVPADDEMTFTGFEEGQFAGVGRVHFSSQRHLRQLFDGFELVLLSEKTTRRLEPKDDHLFASFNIVARKPAN